MRLPQLVGLGEAFLGWGVLGDAHRFLFHREGEGGGHNWVFVARHSNWNCPALGDRFSMLGWDLYLLRWASATPAFVENLDCEEENLAGCVDLSFGYGISL